MAGVNARAHKADAGPAVENGIVHGQDHASGSRRFHDAQVGQLRLRQYGVLEFFQGIPGPGGYPYSPLRSMGQNIGIRCGNVQSFKDSFYRRKIFSIPLGFL